MPIKRYYLFFLILLPFSLYSQDEPNLSIATIPDSLKINANLIYRLKSRTVTIEEIDKLIWTDETIVTFYNKEGEEDFSRCYGFQENVSKVKKFEVEVFDKEGEKVKRLKGTDFYNYSGYQGKMYVADDYKNKCFHYQSPTYPYTLKIHTIYESSTTAWIPNFYFIGRFNASVEKSVYNVIDNTNGGMRVLKLNTEKFNIEENSNSPNKISWSLENVKAIKYYDWAVNTSYVFPLIKVSLNNFQLVDVIGKNISTWEKMGEWQYENLLKGRNNIPEKTLNTIAKLVENCSTDREKAEKIYEFVQNKVRYISIQLGIGGWQPMLASEVDKLSYGDCKALTNYTKTLLESQGIESKYCIVYGSRNLTSIPENFPSISGNHAFLYLPKEDEWLECTSQTVPFGYIAGFTDDRDVLVVSKDGGEIKHTKVYGVEDNVERTEIDLSFSKENTLKGKIVKTSHGVFFSDLKSFESVSKKKDFLENKLSHINNLYVSNIFVDKEKSRQGVMGVSFDFLINDYAKKAIGEFILKPNIFDKIDKINYDNDRALGIENERGYTVETIYHLSLLDGLKLSSKPVSKKINNEFGYYSFEIKYNSKGGIDIKRILKMNKFRYSKEKYSEFCEFINNVSKIDNHLLFLR